jgi:DNA-directed RNA polymerase beta subunit
MKRLSENTKGSDPKRNNRSCVGFGTEPKDDNGHFEDIEPGEHHTARHTAIHSDLQWWRGCIKNTILPAVISSTGLTASHTESFSEFLGVWLRDIVLSVGNIQMKVDDIHYSTTLSNYKFVGSPDSPSTAHSHNSSYLGMIYVDIEEQKSATFEGLRKTTKRYIQSVPICAIPIMLLSSACVLSEDHSIEHQTEQELGGSFVVKGKRRYIPHVRALLNNYPYTFYNTTKQQKYIQVRSNHLNSMHRSTSTLDLYFERDKIGRLLAVQIPKLRIPFLPTAVSVSIVLAILGWSVESFTRVVIDLLSSKLRPGLYAKYEVLLAGTWVSGSSKTEGLRALNKLYGKEQDDATTAQTIVRNEILPHLNEASDPCFEKGVYIAYMFSLLVLFEEELIPESDKDSLATTRIVTSAQSMASLFRILLLDSIRQGIRTIRKDLKIKSTPDISKIYRSSQLTSKLVSAVSTGIWSAKRKGVSHQLITQNKPCILAQMRKISSSVSNTDGKHVLPRMVRADSFGYICGAETQEVLALL